MKNNYNPSTLEPACFYLRKSREDQEAEARGEGETLAKHKKALFKLAKHHGVNITCVFEEIVSGESIIHRPEMLSLLKEVEEGKWRSIWCMDVDRLGRGGMQDQGLILDTLKRANTQIVTPRKVYDLNDEFDEEYTEFEAFMARKELKLITRRLQGGRRRSVEEGNYIGTRPPYGYTLHNDTTGRTLIPHPEQAQVIKLIFDLYTNGQGSAKIAKELNRLGHSTYTGKPWEPSTVLNILKNEVYIGRIQWRKKEEKKSTNPDKKEDVRTRPREEWIDVQGRHEPLVSKARFDQAKKILKEKYHVPYQLVNGQVNPLAGLIKCDMCGGAIVLRPYTNRLSHLICYNPQCPNKSTRFEYVEQALIHGVNNWLEKYQAEIGTTPTKTNSTDIVTIKEKILRGMTKERAELNQQKDRLHDLLEKGIYDEATYLDRSIKLSARIKEADSAILTAESDLSIEHRRQKAQKDIIPKVKKLLDGYYKTTDPVTRNKMLKAVLECAVYRKEKHQKGADFKLVIHPRLPE